MSTHTDLPQSAPRPKPANRSWGILSAVLLGAFSAASLFLGPYFWEHATSRPAVFLAYLGWIALALATAASAAALCIRVLLPSSAQKPRGTGGTAPPRGERPSPADEDFMEDVRSLSASASKRTTLLYSACLTALLLGLVFLGNRLSQGAMSNITLIQYEAMARSPDRDQVTQLFHEMLDMQQAHDVNHFTRKLPDFYLDSRPGIAAAALHTTAIMARRMNLSIAIMNQTGEVVRDRGERELLLWLRSQLSPALRTHYDGGGQPRDQILLALAWIIDEDNVPLFSHVLAQRGTPPSESAAAAIGLGNIGTPELLEPLIKALPWQADSEVKTAILWAIHTVGDKLDPESPSGGDPFDPLPLLQTLLAQWPPMGLQEKCQTIQALRSFNHVGLTRALIERFEHPSARVTCGRVEIVPLFGTPVLFVPDRPLGMLILETLAQMGQGNDELWSWLQKLPLDGRFTPMEEQTARGILAQLKGN